MTTKRKISDVANESKIAVISGASRGIGKAIAIRLATLDYSLFLMGRDRAELDSVANECRRNGNAVICHAGDLEEPEYVNQAIEVACQQLGHVDVLINNAGRSSYGTVAAADMASWQSVMNVNFNATMVLCRYVLPSMIERKQGAIINISSLSGRHTNPGDAIYAATKHAINGFSGCLYEDVRDFGIKVSTIMPGFVDTEMTASIGKRTANMIQADDIADTVEFVLAASPNCCPTEIVIRPQQRP
ncbi:MAG: NADP-dependent 3-hydroxy acid dehydrogenase YdfG [Gammaproteobacteria bacterium]|jgi:NADP-dependent 3-hydroxy acid dehydrogenase YdfG